MFALEAMALGKPVVSHLKPDVVEQSAEGYGVRVPIVPATKDTLVDALRPLVEDAALRRELGAAGRAYVEQVHDIDRIADRLIDIYAGSVGVAHDGELKRLASQSAIYGLGGILSRLIAIVLLPVYTVYLGTVGFGQIETVIALHGRARDPAAARDHERLLPLLLRRRRRAAQAAGDPHVVLVHDGDGDARARGRLCSSPSRSPLRSPSTTRGSSAPASSGSGRR